MSENENEKKQKEQAAQQDASKFLPDIDEMEDAAGVCLDFVSYLRRTQPKATLDINVLEEAANILDAAVAFYDDFDTDSDDDNAEDNEE